MKKSFPLVVISAILISCLSSPVTAGVTNLKLGPSCQRVVYDYTNNLYWYPFLTDTLDMTRAQQEDFISGMNGAGYGGISSWQMATSEQTQALKDSLADTGKRVEHEWPWTPPGSERHMGSPFLAWPIKVDKYFTPTSEMTVGPPLVPEPILDGLPMQVFNGRTTGEWWRTDVPATPYTWQDGEADDHFVVSAYMTPCNYATMTFNYDVHYLPDDATNRGGVFPGPVGTWIVSEVRAIPAPGALLLGSMGVGLVSWFRRRRAF